MANRPHWFIAHLCVLSVDGQLGRLLLFLRTDLPD